MQNQNFDYWAVVELLGRTQYAGHVCTTEVGGASMLKLTVPEVKNQEVTLPEFVKFINHQSVFAITPVSEEYAKQMAVQLSNHPVEGYDHKVVVQQLAKKATKEMKMGEIRRLLSGNTLEEPEEEPVF